MVLEPIIDPNNFKMIGFWCEDRFTKSKLVLRSDDIRELGPMGFLVNDHDVLTEPAELIRIKEVIELGFVLIGKKVVTESGKNIGDVKDYATDPDVLYIQKLYVGKSLLRSLPTGDVTIDRSQIIETTHKQIIIQDATQKVPLEAPAPASAIL